MSSSITKQAVVADLMCVVELATALDLASGIIPLPHGFRFPDGKVIWEDATAGRGKLIRIQRRDGRARYVRADAMFEILDDFSQIVFVEPPA